MDFDQTRVGHCWWTLERLTITVMMSFISVLFELEWNVFWGVNKAIKARLSLIKDLTYLGSELISSRFKQASSMLVEKVYLWGLSLRANTFSLRWVIWSIVIIRILIIAALVFRVCLQKHPLAHKMVSTVLYNDLIRLEKQEKHVSGDSGENHFSFIY